MRLYSRDTLSLIARQRGLKLKPGEYKISPQSPKFKIRGLSLNADPLAIQDFIPKKIISIPDELEIIFTPSTKFPAHFDIIPKNINTTEAEYQALLDQIILE